MIKKLNNKNIKNLAFVIVLVLGFLVSNNNVVFAATTALTQDQLEVTTQTPSGSFPMDKSGSNTEPSILGNGTAKSGVEVPNGSTPTYQTLEDYINSPMSELEKTENPVPHKEYPETGEKPTAEGVVGGLFECSVTSILSNALSELIKGAITSILGGGEGDTEKKVPIYDQNYSKKESGTTIAGIPIFPSWDSIAYCLANKTIAYIADATIYWIRTGFEGNPAFVDNPSRFFQQVADVEYESFMNDVVGEMTCEPYRSSVSRSVAGSYNRSFQDVGKCTLFDGGGDVDGFLNGTSFDYDTWNRYTQVPANNPIGSSFMMQDELNRRIGIAQNNINTELDWGNGYLPWKNMEGNTVSPGNIIESQLEKSLNISRDKLALADEFDEVLTELVNYLVKFALDETLGMVKGE